jgi:hypothetical protein
MRKLVSGGLAATVLAASSPTAAQIWIGQIVGNMMAAGQAARQEHECMMGTAMPVAEVDETRGYTSAAIAAYSAAVSSGGPANASAAWNPDDGKARWIHGETQLRRDRFDRIADPFVAAGAHAEAAPSAYLRSGDGKLVEGQWPARDAAGNLVGVYDGVFTRAAGVWKLRTLSLLNPSEASVGLVQFCHKPGDVEPYKLAYEERQQILELKRQQKAARKAAREAANGGN